MFEEYLVIKTFINKKINDELAVAMFVFKNKSHILTQYTQMFDTYIVHELIVCKYSLSLRTISTTEMNMISGYYFYKLLQTFINNSY